MGDSFSRRLYTFLDGLGEPGGRVFNLSGSSISAYLSGLGRPFIYVEKTEERAQETLRDIDFFRLVLSASGPPVRFLPAPADAEARGQRA